PDVLERDLVAQEQDESLHYVRRALRPATRPRRVLPPRITRRENQQHRHEERRHRHEQHVLRDGEIDRDRPQMHGRELRQVNHTDRTLPLRRVRKVVQDHLLDVEAAALLRRRLAQHRLYRLHVVRTSRLRKNGSRRSSRNRNAARLISAADRGSADVAVTHHATAPSPAKRRIMPPSQPARKRASRPRNASSPANASSWTPYATAAVTRTARPAASSSSSVPSPAAAPISSSPAPAYASHVRSTEALL